MQDRVTPSASGDAQKAAGLSCLTGCMRYKLSSPLQMTNGGSDARLDAVNLENTVC